MPEADHEQAYHVAERLRLAVAGSTIDFGDHRIGLTSSAGIAALASERDTLESILLRADQALYAAKQSGRDRVV
jgi:diguanylate cyclase (GGDEF)-like protein